MLRVLLILFLLLNIKNFAFAESIDITEEETIKDNSVNRSTTATKPKVTKNNRLLLAERNPVAALLCKVIRAFTGTIAKIIALLMLIGLAINLFAATTYNPVSPVTVVSLIIGAGILFSADAVIGKIVGDAGQGGGKSACDCKYGIAEGTKDGNCDQSI